MHKVFSFPILVCTFSSVLFFNDILTNMENAFKASIDFKSISCFIRHSLLCGVWRKGAFTWSLTLLAQLGWCTLLFFLYRRHLIWALTLLSVFSLHFISSSNLCFTHWGEKAWLSSRAWMFTTQVLSLSCEKWIFLSFQFSPLFLVQDYPVFTAG